VPGIKVKVIGQGQRSVSSAYGRMSVVTRRCGRPDLDPRLRSVFLRAVKRLILFNRVSDAKNCFNHTFIVVLWCYRCSGSRLSIEIKWRYQKISS